MADNPYAAFQKPAQVDDPYAAFQSPYIPPGGPSLPQINMQESNIPKIVRSALSFLPAIGGMGGAVAGAPAFGMGSVVGAGLGAGAGEAANIAGRNYLLGENPGTVPSQAKQVGISAALGAASEVPAAAAISMGNRMTSGLARSARLAKQSGDVAAGLADAAPIGLSGKGLRQSIEVSQEKLGTELGTKLRTAQGSVNPDSLLTNARAEAQIANAMSPGSARRFEKILTSAQYNAGIRPGVPASAEQLFKFQQEIMKEGYRGNPGPVAEVVKQLSRSAYSDIGDGVRTLAPEASPILDRLTNMHAAKSAIQKYGPSSMGSAAIMASSHPRTAAVVSPLVTGAAYSGASPLWDRLKRLMPY